MTPHPTGSRPVLPGAEVFHLLGRERVEDDVQGSQLEPGHFDVDRLGHVVYAVGELGVLAAQVLRAERLVSEAHVHDRCRVARGAAQVHEPALSQDVEPLAADGVLDDVLADLSDLVPRQFGEAGQIDLAIEVAELAMITPSRIFLKCSAG